MTVHTLPASRFAQGVAAVQRADRFADLNGLAAWMAPLVNTAAASVARMIKARPATQWSSPTRLALEIGKPGLPSIAAVSQDKNFSPEALAVLEALVGQVAKILPADSFRVVPSHAGFRVEKDPAPALTAFGLYLDRAIAQLKMRASQANLMNEGNTRGIEIELSPAPRTIAANASFLADLAAPRLRAHEPWFSSVSRPLHSGGRAIFENASVVDLNEAFSSLPQGVRDELAFGLTAPLGRSQLTNELNHRLALLGDVNRFCVIDARLGPNGGVQAVVGNPSQGHFEERWMLAGDEATFSAT